MKNKKLTLIASIMLVIAMLCCSLSVAATEGDITTTTEVETTLTEETTTEAPADPTTTTELTAESTTAPADETTTAPEETTTSSDGYYDDSDYETDEEKEAYDDGYWDGYETRGVRKIDGEIYYYTLQHEYIADALYVEYGYLDPVTITKAKIVYPGATVTGKTDAQGRLIEYNVNMPVKGEATGKASFITATVALSGHRNEGFVMDYDV